jgi:hypothetical protein
MLRILTHLRFIPSKFTDSRFLFWQAYILSSQNKLNHVAHFDLLTFSPVKIHRIGSHILTHLRFPPSNTLTYFTHFASLTFYPGIPSKFTDARFSFWQAYIFSRQNLRIRVTHFDLLRFSPIKIQWLMFPILTSLHFIPSKFTESRHAFWLTYVLSSQNSLNHVTHFDSLKFSSVKSTDLRCAFWLAYVLSRQNSLTHISHFDKLTFLPVKIHWITLRILTCLRFIPSKSTESRFPFWQAYVFSRQNSLNYVTHFDLLTFYPVKIHWLTFPILTSLCFILSKSTD